ncbi:hypothetical protein COLO4_38257 [Corchorus olitorius]|uniref:Uncharacterized protein n=1 Tax=Corchorus olitorius TaxID=93759 RepID=A0A1R3FVZ2_9ROSI|nr:hypothetical protein COLO4_38257 [Corchorus olitorius]
MAKNFSAKLKSEKHLHKFAVLGDADSGLNPTPLPRSVVHKLAYLPYGLAAAEPSDEIDRGGRSQVASLSFYGGESQTLLLRSLELETISLKLSSENLVWSVIGVLVAGDKTA